MMPHSVNHLFTGCTRVASDYDAGQCQPPFLRFFSGFSQVSARTGPLPREIGI